MAVTGIGVLTPGGIGAAAFWESLLRPAAHEAVRRVVDLNPRDRMTHRSARNSDRVTQLAIAAAEEALSDAGLLDLRQPLARPAESDIRALTDVDLDRAAVSIGTGIGGVQALESQMQVRLERGERLVSPHLVPMTMPNAPAAALSIRYGLRAAALTTSTACAAGTDAIAAGARLVATGSADLVIAGGTDSSLNPTSLAGFRNMRALSPSGFSRPFDIDRDGLAASETAGILVLEPLITARARGARVYMTITGTASTADAHHVTAPDPHGGGAARAMRLALSDAGLTPADVSHVNAHGTSTVLNDLAEGEAIRQVFGSVRPLVTSIKGVTGHSFGAAGAIEAVAVALTMRHRTIPPTAGLQIQDPAIDLDIARQPTPWQPTPVLSNSFGFGGHNGSVVLSPALDS